MISKFKNIVKYEIFITILSVLFTSYLFYYILNLDYFSWPLFLIYLGLIIFIIINSIKKFLMFKSNPDYYYIKPNYKSNYFYLIYGFIFLILGFLSSELGFILVGILTIINYPLVSSRYILVGSGFLYSNISTTKKYNFKNLKEISITENEKYLKLDFEKKNVLIETFLEESTLEEIVKKIEKSIN